jgi:hypothetical protein
MKYGFNKGTDGEHKVVRVKWFLSGKKKKDEFDEEEERRRTKNGEKGFCVKMRKVFAFLDLFGVWWPWVRRRTIHKCLIVINKIK